MFEAPEPGELTTLLAGYEVTTLIAVGGMGAVYRARQISLDRDVAIKVLPRKLTQLEEFERSFRAEARAMARLHHPNLIGVHDFGEVDGFLYLVMDFVNGKSLFHSAHGKVIEQEEAIRLVHGICEGVGHAHEEGIIHRDIKPANVLLDSHKQPRIGDFGLARRINGSEGEGLHFGTPGYIAPEIEKDSAKADTRSDVYAIGVILYELLTGTLPGEGFVPPSRLQPVDARCDKVVRRAIHPSPDMRFADAGEMARELKTLSEALSNRASRLVTCSAGGASPPAGPSAGKSPAAPDSKVAAMVEAETKAHRRAFVVKLIVIALLLVIIPIVWGAYKRKQASVDRQIQQAARDEAVKKPSPTPPSPVKEPATTTPNRPKPPNRPDPDRPPPPPPQRELTLAELRHRLASGDRTRYPDAAWDVGDRKAYLVKSPMNWHEACRFAEDHGAFLATVADEKTKAALAAELPAQSTIRIGGGLAGPSTWGWIDGTPWSLAPTPADDRGRFLGLTSKGTIKPLSGESKHPFVIMWDPGGGNPGTLDAQLERLHKSLGRPDPLYPPGTFSHEDRRYLIMNDESGWDEAAGRARKAGGHLAVPGDAAENEFLRAMIATALPQGSAAWIGGQFRDGAWTWVTGESWAFSDWIPKPMPALEPDHIAVCFLNGTPGGWDNVDPAGGAGVGAFIIEWSRDHSDATAPAPAPPVLDLASLRKKAAATVSLKTEKHAELIKANGMGMARDLELWITHGLHARARARYRGVVNIARRMVLPSGRISEDGAFPPLPADLAEACNRRLAEQRKLDAQIAKSVDDDRTALLKQINEALETAHQTRLLDQLESLRQAVDSIGDTRQSFFNYLGL